MSGLVLPDPETLTPAMIGGYCDQVESFAAELTVVEEVAEVRDRWDAVTTYMRRKSRDGVARAEATMRRLEARIGELSPSRQGDRSDIGTSPDDRRSSEPPLPRDQMTSARKLADNPDVVEDVIEQSTDEDPPTKKKVLDEIKKRDLQRMSKQSEPEASPRMTVGQAKARWPEVAGPDGVLDASEIETLYEDLVDQLATEPAEDHDRRAAAAATWWRSKTKRLRRACGELVAATAERPGLAESIAGDVRLDRPTRTSLVNARDAIDRFLDGMGAA